MTKASMKSETKTKGARVLKSHEEGSAGQNQAFDPGMLQSMLNQAIAAAVAPLQEEITQLRSQASASNGSGGSASNKNPSELRGTKAVAYFGSVLMKEAKFKGQPLSPEVANAFANQLMEWSHKLTKLNKINNWHGKTAYSAKGIIASFESLCGDLGLKPVETYHIGSVNEIDDFRGKSNCPLGFYGPHKTTNQHGSGDDGAWRF